MSSRESTGAWNENRLKSQNFRSIEPNEFVLEKTAVWVVFSAATFTWDLNLFATETTFCHRNATAPLPLPLCNGTKSKKPELHVTILYIFFLLFHRDEHLFNWKIISEATHLSLLRLRLGYVACIETRQSEKKTENENAGASRRLQHVLVKLMQWRMWPGWTELNSSQAFTGRDMCDSIELIWLSLAREVANFTSLMKRSHHAIKTF